MNPRKIKTRKEEWEKLKMGQEFVESKDKHGPAGKASLGLGDWDAVRPALRLLRIHGSILPLIRFSKVNPSADLKFAK